ncbi:Glucosamine-phosphate N-acetyltransferase-like protein [Thelotrema lepadinum]|nr:Glucosamine-phosphate N-acetyltransferase-like protein [Thelotrema lepadinum]
MSSEDLFDPSLLPIPSSTSTSPPSTTSTPSSTTQPPFSLPPSYSIRPLRRSDYSTGMLDVLKVLTTVGDISEAAWTERFDYMASSKGTYYILVVLDGEGKVVGTGGVVVERKFIHGLGLVGHIEDIAVARDQQGKKLGLSIIQALDAVARGVGCYKKGISSDIVGDVLSIATTSLPAN